MASTITPSSSLATTLHTSASLAAGTAATPDTLDLTNGGSTGGIWEVQLTTKAVFGTVAATAGIKIEVFANYDGTPTYSNTANYTYTIPATGSTTTYSPAIFIPTGKWQVKLTNLDASNAVTCESKYLAVTAVGVV